MPVSTPPDYLAFEFEKGLTRLLTMDKNARFSSIAGLRKYTL
jgi:hypothetical protein